MEAISLETPLALPPSMPMQAYSRFCEHESFIEKSLYEALQESDTKVLPQSLLRPQGRVWAITVQFQTRKKLKNVCVRNEESSYHHGFYSEINTHIET